MEVLLEKEGAKCWRRPDEGGVEGSFLLCQVVIGLSVSNDGYEQKRDKANTFFHNATFEKDFRECKGGDP